MNALKYIAVMACVGFFGIAHAEVTADQKDQITKLVNDALASGDVEKLDSVLASLVTANPADAGNITGVATAAIAANVNSGNAASVTSAVVSTITSVNPASAGDVLVVAQSTLPPSMTVAAVSAVQTALAPAAGGNNNQQQNSGGNKLLPTFSVNSITQTAEVPRRNTASPS